MLVQLLLLFVLGGGIELGLGTTLFEVIFRLGEFVDETHFVVFGDDLVEGRTCAKEKFKILR